MTRVEREKEEEEEEEEDPVRVRRVEKKVKKSDRYVSRRVIEILLFLMVLKSLLLFLSLLLYGAYSSQLLMRRPSDHPHLLRK